MVKSLVKIGSGYNTAPQDAIALLNKIPAELPYSDWFRVAAALKNSGVKFEEFDKWSKTAPAKYDADEAERVWGEVGDSEKEKITIGTLVHLAEKYSSIVSAPLEMLPPPETELEQATQMDKFLELMFRSGESFELVTESAVKDKGKRYPKRSVDNIRTRVDDDNAEPSVELVEFVQLHTDGAWLSLNPVSKIIKGKAPSDDDVTDHRYALIEADDLSKEEQWQKLRELNLPILAVVWSGGKSLHTIVKIDAGNNRELYKKRVKLLHDYLKEKGFPADRSNKNPSRLTRLPGIKRGEDMQHLVARSFGAISWDSFERLFLKKTDLRAETSPVNGLQGGRPFMPVTDYAIRFLEMHSLDNTPQLRYWDEKWWRFVDGVWRNLSDNELCILITRFLQKKDVHKVGRISTALITDTIANLKGLCGLTRITMPCWLPDGQDASDIVCFSNGMLSLKKLIVGDEVSLLPHSPEYFGQDQVKFNYDPDAECPQWQEYLNTTFDDEDVRLAMQRMFGYIISGEVNKNIGFFLIGRGGDGKSVAAHILRKLVGDSQTCCLPFASLGDRFSSYLLTEHKLNLVEELPVSAEVRNISDIEKVFKMVTDGAVIPVERKFHAPQEKRATARCVFLANEAPPFSDRSNGLWDRLVILPFTHRFRDTDSEKANLKYELETELPGIFNWAIEGARQLEKLTRFPLPQASVIYLDTHRLACDHESAFLSENVVENIDGECPKLELYNIYRRWTVANGYKPVGIIRFNCAVKNSFPDVQNARRRSPVDQRIWKGIALQPGCWQYSDMPLLGSGNAV